MLNRTDTPIYYAIASVQGPIPENNTQGIFKTVMNRQAYCQDQLPAIFANGPMPDFITDVLDRPQLAEWRNRYFENLRAEHLSSTKMDITFHLIQRSSNPSIFEAVAFENPVDMTVVELLSPFITGLKPVKVITDKEKIQQLENELRALRASEGPPTIAKRLYR
jgi:hypothetical protein